MALKKIIYAPVSHPIKRQICIGPSISVKAIHAMLAKSIPSYTYQSSSASKTPSDCKMQRLILFAPSIVVWAGNWDHGSLIKCCPTSLHAREHIDIIIGPGSSRQHHSVRMKRSGGDGNLSRLMQEAGVGFYSRKFLAFEIEYLDSMVTSSAIG